MVEVGPRWYLIYNGTHKQWSTVGELRLTHTTAGISTLGHSHSPTRPHALDTTNLFDLGATMAPLRQKDIDAFFSTARSDPAGSPLQVVALDDSSDGRSDIVAISPPVGVLSPPGASGNAPPAGERGESPSAQLDRLFETSDDGEGGGSDSSRGVQLNSTASRWHNTSRRVIPSDGSDNDGPGSNGPSRVSALLLLEG